MTTTTPTRAGAPSTMRSRGRAVRRAVATGSALVLALSACSGAAGTEDASDEPAATVTVTDMSFSPAEVTIEAGETVRWVFDDGGLPHDVSGQDELDGVLQSELLTEGTYEFTFDEPGTYTYDCTPHPMMVGTVVVG